MRPTGVGGARGQRARRLLPAGRRPSGRHALPLPEAGRRKSSLAEGPSPRCVPGSRLAMAMGGGGSSSGVPELEDSVLFRRGTGQVRSQPALSPTSPPRSFLGQSAHCGAVGPHVSISFPTWEPQPQARSSPSLSSLMTLSLGPIATRLCLGLPPLSPTARCAGAGQGEAGKPVRSLLE